jgi:hypothetical protein
LNKQYKILIIVLTLIASTIIGLIRHQYDVFSIIGGSFGIILGPYIIASIIRYGLKLSLWNLAYNDTIFNAQQGYTHPGSLQNLFNHLILDIKLFLGLITF